MDQAFQLKGKLFTLSVLQLQSTDLGKIEQQLNQKIKLAPKFFNDTPVVVDLHEIDDHIEKINLLDLKATLEKYTLIPVGFRAVSEKTHAIITDLKLPLIKEARPTARPQVEKKKIVDTPSSTNNIVSKTEKETKPRTYTSKSGKGTVVIEQQVRSGQQIYAPDGDLVILASVSPGAELLAEGNIHVYGVLRGRALAGLNGDTESRIFCQKLEADLVSIAGQYRLFEESLGESEYTSKGKQVYLKDGQLVIATL
jgi:septum site-determining protein MinC